MALLASHTVDHLPPTIRMAGLQRRLALSLHVAPYGMYRRALLADDPALNAFSPNCWYWRWTPMTRRCNCPLHAGQAEVDAAVAERVDELRLLWRRPASATPRRWCSKPRCRSRRHCSALTKHWCRLRRGQSSNANAAIRGAAREDGVLLLDLAGAAAYGDGLADPVRWYRAKQLVSPALAPLYGDHLARIAAAAAGCRTVPRARSGQHPVGAV